jgi:hypothetical protein
VKVTMLLCDHAQVAEGKLFIAGGGWSACASTLGPTSIAMVIGVPWDRANASVAFSLRLVDADGHPVQHETLNGSELIAFEGSLEVGRPPGLPPGSALDVPMAFQVPPMILAPGSRYIWELTLDDELREDWRLPFSTRPA